MSISVNFEGATLFRPGVYTTTKVQAGGAAQPRLGIMAIIGEADQGDSFANEAGGVAAVSWSPDQYAAIKAKYGSGPMVDAARLAFNASNDPDIQGGAQLLITLKTNQSTKSQLVIPSSYGTIKAKKAGLAGNSLTAAISIVSQQAIITLTDELKGVQEISSAIGGNVALNILSAAATSATLTINATTITTTAVGGGAAALSIPKKQFNTIGQLVTYISNQAGYTCTIVAGQDNRPLSDLDQVSGVDIKTGSYGLKTDAADIAKFFAASALVDFTPTATAGLPTALVKTYLSGGAAGATSQANFQACLDALLGQDVDFIVPLFARDASADITDGLTDASSAYLIDSIHAGIRSHVAAASTVKGRHERQAIAAFKGSYANSKLKQTALAAARVKLHIQDSQVQDSTGTLVVKQPWALATMDAAMKCAAVVGLSNLNKKVQISGFSHVDFDPSTQADDALANNICFVEKAPGGGFQFGADNTTYALIQDAWIWNRSAVIYAADFAAKTLRLNLQKFIAKRNSDISPETVKNQLVVALDALRGAGVIVADGATNGKGYKDLAVTLTGNQVSFNVTLALVENIEFILGTISVQRAQF
jgi:hypothetical protein